MIVECILKVVLGIHVLDVICDVRKKALLANTEISEIGMYEVPMVMSLLRFGIMFSKFHMCWMMFLLNAMVYMLLRYMSPRAPMCFRCLMFNLL